MDDMNNCSRDCDVQIYCGRAAHSGGGLVKTNKIAKKVILAAMLVLSPWYAYAEAERFAGVQEQLSGLAASANAGVDQAEMVVPQSASLDVSAGGENAQSEIANQELASLDAAVDIGASRRIQTPQPVSIVSRSAASLEVVDTGVVRNVQNPQPAAAISPEEGISTSGDGQGARNYELMLPVSEVTEKNQVTGKTNRQTEDVSGSAVSSEPVELPYAVLLVILALMSMIPISRRNG